MKISLEGKVEELKTYFNNQQFNDNAKASLTLEVFDSTRPYTKRKRKYSKRRFSKSALNRIAAAQRERWAKAKAAQRKKNGVA